MTVAVAVAAAAVVVVVADDADDAADAVAVFDCCVTGVADGNGDADDPVAVAADTDVVNHASAVADVSAVVPMSY